MKNVLFLLVISTLSGCMAKQAWTHKSKSSQQFYGDLSRCEAMSNSAGQGQMMYGGNAFANGYNQGVAVNAANSRKRIFTNCMRGEGWYLTEVR
ncbi:MAG: hypothetical protein WBB19_02115 [Desulforhopalus sp.]